MSHRTDYRTDNPAHITELRYTVYGDNETTIGNAAWETLRLYTTHPEHWQIDIRTEALQSIDGHVLSWTGQVTARRER